MLKNKWLLIILVLAIGIVIGRLTDKSSNDEADTHVEDVVDGNQIWTCSMHPQIQQNEPGKCPLCGMDLIPLDVSIDNEEAFPDEVPMSESAMKLAEIQTYLLKKEKPEKEIQLLGKVKADERLMFSQTIHFPGRIEKLFINFTGEKVKKGQKLASVYSSELVTAQKELFEVLKDKTTNRALIDAARNKLKQWKFTEDQIAALERSGKIQTEANILSDYNGYVMTKKVSEGDHLKEGQILFEITDLSKVWVLFEAYEGDLPWIKLGDKIEVEFKAIPGKRIMGKVSFIDPFVNPKTRVAYVRIELPNIKGQLKPEMFANGNITSKLPLNGESILIPKSAVLWTGKRAVVYVKVPDRKHNSFIYREIVLGEDAGDFYIVKEGLEVGEEVASNGVFKIDASAQLAGKKSMMNPAGTKKKSGKRNGDSIIDQSQIPSKFKVQVGEVVKTYLSLKNKLVNDSSLLKRDVKTMEKALGKVDMSLVIDEAHNVWMKNLKILNEEIVLMSRKINIDEQRKVFLAISNSLYDVVKKLGVELEDNDTLYLQFCPMANNNNGGHWFSLEKNNS